MYSLYRELIQLRDRLSNTPELVFGMVLLPFMIFYAWGLWLPELVTYPIADLVLLFGFFVVWFVRSHLFSMRPGQARQIQLLSLAALLLLAATHHFHLQHSAEVFMVPLLVAAVDFGALGTGLTTLTVLVLASCSMLLASGGQLGGPEFEVLGQQFSLVVAVALAVGWLTDRYRTELSIPELVIDVMEEPVVMIDHSGIVTLINRAAEEIIDISHDTALGKPAAEVFAQSSRLKGDTDYAVVLLESLNKQEEMRGEEVSLKLNGERQVLLFDTHLIRSAHGKLLGLLAIGKDVSELKRQQQLLRRANEQLASLSLTDELTGAYNLRYFQQKMQEEQQRARELGTSFALLMIDIDHFKDFNDSYGHQAGDTALRHVTGSIEQAVRKTDLVVRYGGEEFAVILPAAEAGDAPAVAERIRQTVADRLLELNGERHSFTVSLGIAEYPRDAVDITGLIRAADTAMYAAKRQGRNSVCQFGSDMEELAEAAPSRDEGTSTVATSLRLATKIEQLRSQLVAMAEAHDSQLDHPEILRLSQGLDDLVAEYQREALDNGHQEAAPEEQQ